MARVGLSYARYAMYNYAESGITYTNGGSLGKAIKLDIQPDSGDENILYADNAPAESAPSFSGGTVTVGTDDLPREAESAILGHTMTELTTPEATKVIVRKADDIAPYVGVGGIVKRIKNGATVWNAIILTKVQFKDPGLSVETQGETVDWQTPEIEGTFFRDDSEGGPWNMQGDFSTEDKAKQYIDSILVPATGAD